jgi:YVTN family beta-propeller protein
VSRFRQALVGVSTVALAVAGAVSASSDAGRIGPDKQETPNGRVLHPAGALTTVGNFPTGGALTPNGKYYWAVSTGRGLNDIRIVDVRTNRVVQVVPIPGASGGIAMDPSRPLVYVSGVADSSHTNEQRPHLAGRGGDVVDVYRYNARTGRAAYRRLFSVPPPSGSPIPQGVVDLPGLEGPPQNFPPTNTQRLSWPDRLAVSPDGGTLLIPLNLADHAAIVNTKTGATSYVQVGHYPYGAAISPNGKTGYVTNEGDGTVSVIDLGAGSKTSNIQVGANLSHPEPITIDARSNRAYVAMANTDRIGVIDLKSNAVVGRLSLEPGQGLGAIPVGLAVDPAAHRLYVADEGTDDVAVLNIAKAKPTLAGRIPTASFPTDVALSHRGCGEDRSCGRVVWLSGKGFGFGPNPNGPNPLATNDTDNRIGLSSYLPSAIRGMVGVLRTPSAAALRTMTATALHQAIPVNRTAPPSGTPLRANGPIKHVFYIVKENRTYDQVLGDVTRGDGDRSLELFGPRMTPNVHALVQRFPLLDHVYANSEASIDGHFWTSAGSVSDYVQKNWMQNYGGRGRPYDFGVYSITWPGNGFLFDQAQRQGISYFNYGEAIAGELPLPDKDRSPQQTAEVLQKFAHSDLGAGGQVGVGATPAGECYPNDADIATDAVTGFPTYDGTPPAGASANSESRFECFKQHFEQQVQTGTVPAFNYLVLPNDHTVGTTPGERTPQAMIADNDYGVGEVVDEISHSQIWKSSAIFVVEDDSQDGADHVDAHRIPAEVISPYAQSHAVISDRYDFLSVIRSMELILGMKPLGFADAVAEPMYDAFSSKPVNLAPYTAIVPKQSRSATNTATSPDATLSSSLDFSQLDQVPQQTLDEILWHAVYGQDSTPPPPGPNATSKQSDQ